MKKLFAILCSLIVVSLNSLIGARANALGPNLVPNPSIEQNTSGKPNSWQSDKWGTNTATFSYANTGSHTGTYSVTTKMTAHSSGDAKWYFAPVAVTGNTSYTFSDWYKSSVKSTLDVEVTSTDNKVTYLWLGDMASSGNVWKQATYTFTAPASATKVTVYHSIQAIGSVTTDDYYLATTSGSPAPAPTPTPPTVSLTAPAPNTTITGSTTLSAVASDAGSVASVQFKVDGVNVGSADTTAPYSYNWDSTSATNAAHTITAVATNSANLTTTSVPVTVTVNNQVTSTPPIAAPANLLANPSFESANGAEPANWISSNWGTNTSSFSYLNTGHTGSHSVKVQTTSYTNGAANWYYNEVPVTAGKTYLYSNWYQSNVDTEVDAEVTMSDGSVQYYWLGAVFANTSWTQFKTTFSPPAGAKSIAIYQILAKVGYIVSDDYSLSEYTPLPFNRGIVSVTFDDGWANQYKNAFPVLKQLAIPSTFYIISGELTDQPDYMSALQVKDLYASGEEIGSHSVTHPDLTTLSATQLQNEMSNSKTTLQNLLGSPVTDFAYPYGAYNAATINVGKQYYMSQRTVNGGLNTRDNLDATQLKIYEVDSNISQAQVQGWINSALADHAWLILCYHEIATTPTAPDDALYTTQPSDFTAEMNYLKNSGVAIETVNQALTEVSGQR